MSETAKIDLYWYVNYLKDPSAQLYHKKEKQTSSFLTRNPLMQQ